MGIDADFEARILAKTQHSVLLPRAGFCGGRVLVVLYVRLAWIGALFWTHDDQAERGGTLPRQSLLVKPLPELAVNFGYILPQFFYHDLAVASEFRHVGT
jgi:hypothetical protein